MAEAIARTVREYYDALRAGEPLAPFFAERADAVKFGISEHLEGYDEIERALREQTRTTTDWTIESRDLRTGRRGDVGWFSDRVSMAWTNAESGRNNSFDARWSGTLERRDGEWVFVQMHVSAPNEVQ